MVAAGSASTAKRRFLLTSRVLLALLTVAAAANFQHPALHRSINRDHLPARTFRAAKLEDDCNRDELSANPFPIARPCEDTQIHISDLPEVTELVVADCCLPVRRKILPPQEFSTEPPL